MVWDASKINSGRMQTNWMILVLTKMILDASKTVLMDQC
jgi:hypothetical protein